MHKLHLIPEEVEVLNGLTADLARRYQTVEDPQFMRNTAVYAHELPQRIRVHMNDFRLQEPTSALCIISGFPIDDEAIGATPPHWNSRSDPSPTLAEEMLLLLFGSLVGDPIGWATQQSGYIVHDICPCKGHEHEQLGSGSEELLWWHTEDAFHPYRGEYIGMACLRNPDHVATTFANLEGIDPESDWVKRLFEPHFTIKPDESHLIKNKSGDKEVDRLLQLSYERIERMNREPEKIAVLYGESKSPYIRIDPYFMNQSEDPEAREALEHIRKWIDDKLDDLVLMPGDFCFIDNFKAVHGRKPFKARFDGTDRWLKRINVTRDLRRSRTARLEPEARVIY